MPLHDIPEVITVEPETYIGFANSGHMHAIKLMCKRADSSTSTLYLVKTNDGTAAGHLVCAKELFSALLGICFELKIPIPVVVAISPEFCDCIPEPPLQQRFMGSIGPNFGSTYYEKQAPIFQSVSENHIQDALNVFAFDVLTQNPDRRVQNPNMYQTPGGFILFDHEMAFPFVGGVYLIGGICEAWEPGNIQNPYVKNHAMYKFLKREPVAISEFTEKLAGLNDELLDTIISRMPIEWQTDEFATIKAYLLRASQNAQRFERGLQEALA